MFEIPYGDHFLVVELHDRNCEVIQAPLQVGAGWEAHRIIRQAFQHPSGDGIIPRDITEKTIAIAINDQTRPLPYGEILEPLIAHLVSLQANPEQMRFFIATGTHKPLTEHEITQFVPEAITTRFPIICHDCDQTNHLMFLGRTTAGTPVWVNRAFYEADIRIVIGNIEPHHFMGYSGGMKTAAIGLGGRETITKNHAMLSHPNAKMGLYKNNPMRMDVEEIGRLMGVHFAFNIVMDSGKRIVSAYWGEPEAVVRAGIAYYQEHFQMDLGRHLHRYDLVIASPGGYPKDINLYQAQKALTHACLFAKKGATIILAAECRDGYGSQSFEEFMNSNRTAEKIIDAFEKTHFRIGPHKAYQLALQAGDHRIILVSDIENTQPIGGLLNPLENMNAALDQALNNLPGEIEIAVLPDATHVLPKIDDL